MAEFDPNVPLGSESLKLGPSRFQSIEKNILLMVGFDGTTAESFKDPFVVDPATGLVTVVGVPVAPLGIATKNYIDQRTQFMTVSSSDAVTYMGTVAEPFNTYQEGSPYVLLNAGGANAAGMMLQLSDGPVKPVFLSDGVTAVPAGKFASGIAFLFVFINDAFRLLDFIGGTVVEPIVLPAAPTLDLQAATKGYVDLTVGHTFLTSLGTEIDFKDHAVVDVMSTTVMTPATDNYIVRVDFNIWVVRQSGTDMYPAAWIDVNGVTFGAGTTFVTSQTNGSTNGINGGGFCVTVFPASTAITVKIRAQVNTNDEVKIVPSVTEWQAPASQMTVTLLRTGV